ncbi:MAG: hypothetical protein ACKVP0_24775 [Pirellulaceae bacterium]
MAIHSQDQSPSYVEKNGWLRLRRRVPKLDSHHFEFLLSWSADLASPLRYALMSAKTELVGDYPLSDQVNVEDAKRQLQRRIDWDWPGQEALSEAAIIEALAQTGLPFRQKAGGWEIPADLSAAKEAVVVERNSGRVRAQIRLWQVPDDALSARTMAQSLSCAQGELRFARIEIDGENYCVASEAGGDALMHELPHCVQAVIDSHKLLAGTPRLSLRPKGYGLNPPPQDELPRPLF